jgi:hypothetical protein
MMQDSISNENSHQDQYPCTSPAPLTPHSSWSHLSECPAPPERVAGDFFGTMECSSNIYMPMLASTLSPRTELDERPVLRPRPSFLSFEHAQNQNVLSTQIVTSSYPHFPSADSRCPSAAALDDESCSLSDESTDESFADYSLASGVHFEGPFLKESTLWACSLPSMINGDSSSVRLHPRSLSLRPNFNAQGKSSPPLMPMSMPMDF